MKKIISFIIKLIGYIIFSVLCIAILIMGICYYQINIKKSEYVNLFGYSFFEVISGSMADTINIGDLVIIKLKDYDLNVNDIITYKKNNDIITHRIVEINGESLICKGDNNNTEDAPITRDIIIGKKVYMIQGVGTIKEVLFTSKVMLSIIITIVLFSIYFSLKEKDKKND